MIRRALCQAGPLLSRAATTEPRARRGMADLGEIQAPACRKLVGGPRKRKSSPMPLAGWWRVSVSICSFRCGAQSGTKANYSGRGSRTRRMCQRARSVANQRVSAERRKKPVSMWVLFVQYIIQITDARLEPEYGELLRPNCVGGEQSIPLLSNIHVGKTGGVHIRANPICRC